MMEKEGDIYKYDVYFASDEKKEWRGWVYDIYHQENDKFVRESSEWFESMGEAKLAATGHISLLENGEG